MSPGAEVIGVSVVGHIADERRVQDRVERANHPVGAGVPRNLVALESGPALEVPGRTTHVSRAPDATAELMDHHLRIQLTDVSFAGGRVEPVGTVLVFKHVQLALPNDLLAIVDVSAPMAEPIFVDIEVVTVTRCTVRGPVADLSVSAPCKGDRRVEIVDLSRRVSGAAREQGNGAEPEARGKTTFHFVGAPE